MKIFSYGKEKHICNLSAYVAGGSEEEAERGIYQCRCGIRWENMEEYNPLLDTKKIRASQRYVAQTTNKGD